MTGKPVRDTKFASWIDNDAWMEKMSGSKWSNILKEESSLIKSHTNNPEVKKRINEFVTYYKQQKETHAIFQHGLIQIEWHSDFFKKWWFINSPEKKHECRDIVVTQDAIYCTVDIKDGAEYFELQKWSSPYNEKPDFKISPVGPEVAASDCLYYLGVKNKLIYHELWKTDFSGKNRILLYTEKSPEVNLAILKLSNGRTLLARENSQDFIYHTIHDLKLTHKYDSLNLPIKDYGIEWTWKEHNFAITKTHGQKIFWKGSKKLLDLPAGEILVDPYAVYSNILPCLVLVYTPIGISQYILKEDSLELIEKNNAPLQCKQLTGTSKDGTTVHGILTYKKNPKHLFAIGYGAYGMESHTSPVNTRWGPLVKNDWAILYTFLRGGGDHDESWAKAGRLNGRTKTIEDFEALIVSAQNKLKIGPEHTVIYGRSAGGLLMGGSLNNHPDGSLMGGIYAEVPYVDELRTTTNPGLPLTTLEHNEFGNPNERLEDFLSVGLLSPADAATLIKSPNIFVLTRTAEFDSQVFAYEPVKWIRRLRHGGGIKLCIIEKGQGHFTPPDTTINQWAVDCALIDSWISGILR